MLSEPTPVPNITLFGLKPVHAAAAQVLTCAAKAFLLQWWKAHTHYLKRDYMVS